MRGYRAPWLCADALAGLSLVAVALPAQMATARLAGLPAVAGLYAFVAGSLLYALLGTDRHLSAERTPPSRRCSPPVWPRWQRSEPPVWRLWPSPPCWSAVC